MCEAEFDICVMTCASMRNENHLSVVDLGLSDTVSSICRTFHSISTNLVFKNKKRIFFFKIGQLNGQFLPKIEGFHIF